MEFLLLFVEQQDGDVLQMKIIARNHQDLPQDLVQIEGRQHRLTGIVEDGDLLHSARGFYRFRDGRPRFRK